ncbi:MAG: PAS domain S-box protein [Dehalococcoidales bacterium]|nr:PAS domain S-box protein [Dehalococcoidales bacterium]
MINQENVPHDPRQILLDDFQDAVITTDRDLNITSWSKAAEDLFGWKTEDTTGEDASRHILGKILGCLTGDGTLDCLVKEGCWNGLERSLKKDGSPVETIVSLNILWDKTGSFNGLAAVFRYPLPGKCLTEDRDRIERIVMERTDETLKANRLLRQELDLYKRAALLARESEGKNRDLVDNIKLGIFRCTPGARGRFLEVNMAMEEITGYSRDELQRMEASELNLTSEDGSAFNYEVDPADWKATRELRLRQKSGNWIVIARTIVAIRFESGSVQFMDGIIEDITERKQAQSQVQQSLERLKITIREIIQAMAYIGEVRDPYTAGHQRRVAQLSCEISRLIQLGEDQQEGLNMAAAVHDIGKILVPSDILSKPGKLTKPEFDMLKDHTKVGFEILKNIDFPWPIANIVLQHHERMDGSGYPSGLKGNQIIHEARILAVADVVEAMSSHRPYRPALGIQKALEEIRQNRGILYDSDAVDACIELFVKKGYVLN